MNSRGRPSSARRISSNLLLIAASFAVAFAAAELVFRAFGNQPLYEVYSKPSLFWRYDSLLGWSHEPGSKGRYVGPRPWPIEFTASVSINSLGLRGPEISPRVPGGLRLLFLGDSVVAGFEVEYEHTFAARLRPLLEDRLDRPVSTINAGVRGYGGDQSYLYYRERGKALNPDAVIFFHSRNDPADNMTLHEMRRPFGKPALRPGPNGKLELVNSPVPAYPVCSETTLGDDYSVVRTDGVAGRLLCRAQLALFNHSALFSVITVAVPWNSDLLREIYYVGNPHANQLQSYAIQGSSGDPSRRLTNAVVLELAESVREGKASFLVIGEAPHLEQLDLDALRRSHVTVEPLDSILEVPRNQVRWQHDAHYTPRGHELVALELAPVIERLVRSAEEARR